MGRWINRDPIGERGGENLFGHGLNNPINILDLLGMASICVMYAADTSVEDVEKARKDADDSTDFLRKKLVECCKKFKVACGVKLTAGFSSKRPKAPTGGYNETNIKLLTNSIGGNADYNVIITATMKPNTGQSGKDWGSIVGEGSKSSTPGHEIGHDAGYKSRDPYDGHLPQLPEAQTHHDNDAENLMYPVNKKGNREVDCEWCLALTKKADE